MAVGKSSICRSIPISGHAGASQKTSGCDQQYIRRSIRRTSADAIFGSRRDKSRGAEADDHLDAPRQTDEAQRWILTEGPLSNLLEDCLCGAANFRPALRAMGSVSWRPRHECGERAECRNPVRSGHPYMLRIHQNASAALRQAAVSPNPSFEAIACRQLHGDKQSCLLFAAPVFLL